MNPDSVNLSNKEYHCFSIILLLKILILVIDINGCSPKKGDPFPKLEHLTVFSSDESDCIIPCFLYTH